MNREIPAEYVGMNETSPIGLVVVVVVFDSLIIVMYPYVFCGDVRSSPGECIRRTSCRPQVRLTAPGECIANVVATVEKFTKNNSVTNGLYTANS